MVISPPRWLRRLRTQRIVPTRDYTNWQNTSLSNYNNDIGSYMSNVNSQLAAGNPYQSKSYLTNQNLQTSGAMNSTNDAAQQQLRDTALRTGNKLGRPSLVR